MSIHIRDQSRRHRRRCSSYASLAKSSPLSSSASIRWGQHPIAVRRRGARVYKCRRNGQRPSPAGRTDTKSSLESSDTIVSLEAGDREGTRIPRTTSLSCNTNTQGETANTIEAGFAFSDTKPYSECRHGTHPFSVRKANSLVSFNTWDIATIRSNPPFSDEEAQKNSVVHDTESKVFASLSAIDADGSSTKTEARASGLSDKECRSGTRHDSSQAFSQLRSLRYQTNVVRSLNINSPEENHSKLQRRNGDKVHRLRQRIVFKELRQRIVPKESSDQERSSERRSNEQTKETRSISALRLLNSKLRTRSSGPFQKAFRVSPREIPKPKRRNPTHSKVFASEAQAHFFSAGASISYTKDESSESSSTVVSNQRHSAEAAARRCHDVLRRRWKVGKVIGSGNFGQTRIAHDLLTGELVAVKLESVGNKKAGHLEKEYKIFRALQGGRGIPEILYYGKCTEDYNAMIVELLGPSLKVLFEQCGGSLSVETVAVLAVQLLERFEFIHSKRVVHRDVKPDNFLMGRDKTRRIVNVIDFGLAKFYVDPLTNVHSSFSTTKAVTGTVRYMSLNTHRGIQQSRRDDLESLGYMFVYLLKGVLPWQKVKDKDNKRRYHKILEVKKSTPLSELTKGLPHEFREYLDYTRQLSFFSAPNYAHLQKMFLELLRRRGFQDISRVQFDWEEQELQVSGSDTISNSPSEGDVTFSQRKEGRPTFRLPSPQPRLSGGNKYQQNGHDAFVNEFDLDDIRRHVKNALKLNPISDIPLQNSVCASGEESRKKKESLKIWCCLDQMTK